jgi:hypothetical protein
MRQASGQQERLPATLLLRRPYLLAKADGLTGSVEAGADRLRHKADGIGEPVTPDPR